MLRDVKSTAELKSQIKQLSDGIDFFKSHLKQAKESQDVFLKTKKQHEEQISQIQSHHDELKKARDEARQEYATALAEEKNTKTNEEKLLELKDLFHPADNKFTEEVYGKIRKKLEEEKSEYEKVLGTSNYKDIYKKIDDHLNQWRITSLVTAPKKWFVHPGYYYCRETIDKMLVSLQDKKPDKVKLKLTKTEQALVDYKDEQKKHEEQKQIEAARLQYESSQKEHDRALQEKYRAMDRLFGFRNVGELKTDFYDIHSQQLGHLEHEFVFTKRNFLKINLDQCDQFLEQIKREILSFDDQHAQATSPSLAQVMLIHKKLFNDLEQRFQHYEEILRTVQLVFQELDEVFLYQKELSQSFATQLSSYESTKEKLKKVTLLISEKTDQIQKYKNPKDCTGELKQYQTDLSHREYVQSLRKYKSGELSDDFVSIESKFLDAMQERLDDIEQTLKSGDLTKTKKALEEKRSQFDLTRPQYLQFAPKRFLVKKEPGSDFTEAEIKNLNGKDFTDITHLNNVTFRCRTNTTATLRNIKFDHIKFTDCRFGLRMDKVSFKSSNIKTCTFATYKGTFFDEKTEWNSERDSAKVLFDNLSDPLYNPQDDVKDYLSRLIQLVHDKDQKVISSQFILTLIQRVCEHPIALQYSHTKNIRVKFIMDQMLDKITSLAELAEFSALLKDRRFQFLRQGREFGGLITKIKNRIKILTNHSEEHELTIQNQIKLNEIMNYNQGIFATKINVGESFFNRELKSMDMKHANIDKKIEELKKYADLYDSQSLYSPKGSGWFRIGKDYREKLFKKSLELLNLANPDQIRTIQLIIRKALITNAGAREGSWWTSGPKYRTFQDEKHILDDLLKIHKTLPAVAKAYNGGDEKVYMAWNQLKSEVWGISTASDISTDDPRKLGTTHGGSLMNQICNLLIQIKSTSENQEAARKNLTDKMNELRGIYPTLETTKMSLELEQRRSHFLGCLGF